jgi:hypothetical protein
LPFREPKIGYKIIQAFNAPPNTQKANKKKGQVQKKIAFQERKQQDIEMGASNIAAQQVAILPQQTRR